MALTRSCCAAWHSLAGPDTAQMLHHAGMVRVFTHSCDGYVAWGAPVSYRGNVHKDRARCRDTRAAAKVFDITTQITDSTINIQSDTAPQYQRLAARRPHDVLHGIADVGTGTTGNGCRRCGRFLSMGEPIPQVLCTHSEPAASWLQRAPAPWHLCFTEAWGVFRWRGALPLFFATMEWIQFFQYDVRCRGIALWRVQPSCGGQPGGDSYTTCCLP